MPAVQQPNRNRDGQQESPDQTLPASPRSVGCLLRLLTPQAFPTPRLHQLSQLLLLLGKRDVYRTHLLEELGVVEPGHQFGALPPWC